MAMSLLDRAWWRGLLRVPTPAPALAGAGTSAAPQNPVSTTETTTPRGAQIMAFEYPPRGWRPLFPGDDGDDDHGGPDGESGAERWARQYLGGATGIGWSWTPDAVFWALRPAPPLPKLRLPSWLPRWLGGGKKEPETDEDTGTDPGVSECSRTTTPNEPGIPSWCLRPVFALASVLAVPALPALAGPASTEAGHG